MALGSLVGHGFVRIDADTSPAKKAIMALGAIGSQVGLGALGSMIAPVTTATLALANSFAVAGGAATAFGAAVIPQFQDISKAMQQQTTAEDAKTKAAVNASIAQDLARQNGFKYGQQVEITADMTEAAKDKAKEYNAALSASDSASKSATQSQALYKQQLSTMPKATQDTTKSLLSLKEETKEWSRSLAGNTMPIFTRGIDALRNLLPKLTPIVKDVSSEITSFAATLGEGTAGRVFREFGSNVTKNGAGALRSFLNITRNVLVGVIGLFNAFAPASKGVTGGLEELTRKFAEWSAGLSKSQGFQDFLDRMRTMGPELMKTFGQIARTSVTIVQAMGPLAGLSLKIAQAFASLIDAIPTPILKILVQAIVATNVALKLYAIYTAAAAAATWLHTHANIAGTASLISLHFQLILLNIQQKALALWTGIVTAATYAWGVAVAVATSPITLVVIAIAALVAGIVYLATQTRFFQTVWNAVWKGVSTAFAATVEFIKRNWMTMLAVFGGPVGLAILYVIKNFDKLRDGAMRAVDSVVEFFRKLPGRITGAVGDLGRLLVGAGEAVLRGLLSGATSVARTIGTWFTSNVKNPTVSFFSNAGSWLISAGRSTIAGLISGQLAIARTIGGWLGTHVKNPTVNFFKGAGSWLMSAGRSAITGLLSGQLMIARTIGSWFSRNVKNPTVSFFRSAASWLVSGGRSTINGLISGLRAVASGLSSWFTRNVKNPIVSRFSEASSWLFSGGKKIITGMASGFWEALKSVGDWASKIKNAIVGAIKGVFGIKSPSRVMSSLGGMMMRGLLNGLLKGKDFLKSAVKGMFKNPVAAAKQLIKSGINVVGFLGKNAAKYSEELFGSLGLGTSKGVERFKTTVALALRMLGQPIGLMGITLKRMQQESGGNPNIVNRWDSNWKAGTPSVGLMQVIGPTFRAYAGKYAKTGPFLYGVSVNPLANIYASMRYALSRYGSLSSAYGRAGGYDRGGLARGMGWWPKYTNEPERILSPSQTKLFERMITGRGAAPAPSGSTLVIERLVLENHGVIGSKQQLENWLVDSLDQLKRKGRL